jgi:hypothetical protein
MRDLNSHIKACILPQTVVGQLWDNSCLDKTGLTRITVKQLQGLKLPGCRIIGFRNSGGVNEDSGDR